MLLDEWLVGKDRFQLAISLSDTLQLKKIEMVADHIRRDNNTRHAIMNGSSDRSQRRSVRLIRVHAENLGVSPAKPNLRENHQSGNSIFELVEVCDSAEKAGRSVVPNEARLKEDDVRRRRGRRRPSRAADTFGRRNIRER